MATTLTEDILSEILIKLPTKSLLRFRCVSKSWYSLISAPNFIMAHTLHHCHHPISTSIIMQRWDERNAHFRFTLHKDNESLDYINEFDHPMSGGRGSHQFYHVLDCIAGLVCLFDGCKLDDNLVLWNPIVGKMLVLPKPIIGDEFFEDSSFGFGFDPLECDFKVVRVAYVGQVGGESLVEVFRLSTKSWMRVDHVGDLPSVVGRQAYVDGYVNWVCSNGVILAFDVGGEVFKEIVLPKALSEVDVQGLNIAVWKGFLSVFGFECFGCLIGGRIPADGRVSLWVMKEYGSVESWTRQFVIEPFASFRQVRGIRANGHIVFESLHGNLDCYDPETEEIKTLALPVQGTLTAFRMDSYRESLALLDVGARQHVRPGFI